MNLAKEIRERREAAGMSRFALAVALKEAGMKVHPSTVQNWEIGRSEPHYSELIALQAVLGIRFNGGEKAKALD